MDVHTEYWCDKEACQQRYVKRYTLGLPTADKCIHFWDSDQCDRECQIASLQTLIAVNNALEQR